ncbi:MAG: tRNA1(Val) (adenine(37)-N6)-methyltransferase [Candidatus Cryptobacteroides sp.]
MSVFNFKRFSVVNEKSAMKVNTDGVLLGAWMDIRPDDRRLLDVGTGTGTIALMAAQRLMDIAQGISPELPSADDLNPLEDVVIDAVEIDADSAIEAGKNFSNSPWGDVMRVHNCAFSDFYPFGKYDLIFSNPPYFDSSLLAPERRRCDARHTSSGLSFRELLEFASDYLTPEGRIAIVLPSDQEKALCRYARMCSLHLQRILRVRTVPRKQPGRIIAEFSPVRSLEPRELMLTIQNEGKYTEEYLSLTHDFYLFA